MSSTFPQFKIYESNGVTLVYTFDAVTNWEPNPFFDPETFVEHTSLRGQGSIVSAGSSSAWDFSLTFRLSDENYEALIAKMQNVVDTIVFNTKYILKIDLTTGGSTKDLKIKRLQPIEYPIENNNKVVTSQSGTISFRVNSWS